MLTVDATMTGFSDLPHELVVEVWRQVVDPESVENFALVSKPIYALGKAFISLHNQLRAKFSTIAYCEEDVGSGPAETLETLLLNPRAASYVRNITMDGWRDVWEDSGDPGKPSHRPYPEDTMELFRQCIKDSRYIMQDEIVFWLRALEAGCEGVIYSLILTILPALYSLKLPCVYPSHDLLLDTIKRMSGSRDTEPLSRLAEVQLLRGYNNIPVYDEEFDWLSTFATLPSIKTIKAWDIGPGCDCPNHDEPGYDCISKCYGPDEEYDCNHWVCHDRRLLLPPKTSAITHVTFTNCELTSTRLYNFLKGLRELKTFEYISVNRSIEYSEVREIVDALRAHAKSTLQTLRLGSSSELTYHACTLVDFEVMKELEIPGDLMIFNKDVGVLPPSIEKVHLTWLETNLHYMVKTNVLDMAEDKAELSPNLKEITIELRQIGEGFDIEMIPTMRQKCEDAGILLNVIIQSPVTTDQSPSEVDGGW